MIKPASSLLAAPASSDNCLPVLAVLVAARRLSEARRVVASADLARYLDELDEALGALMGGKP